MSVEPKSNANEPDMGRWRLAIPLIMAGSPFRGEVDKQRIRRGWKPFQVRQTIKTEEFDPGSERTLAAWLRHASRTDHLIG